jgi:hypothetical protein
MKRVRWGPVVLALVAASCSASYPAAPDPTWIALQVFYVQPMSYAAVGSTYSFSAYAIRSDGAYEDVTSAAAWTSTDWRVLCPLTTAGSFAAAAAGQADVAVRWDSMVGILSIPVNQTDRLTYPRLSITGGSGLTVSAKTHVILRLMYSAALWDSVTVTDLATWTSANPAVVKVEGGLVTGVHAGTTQISATYNGLTVEYGLSVHPIS